MQCGAKRLPGPARGRLRGRALHRAGRRGRAAIRTVRSIPPPPPFIRKQSGGRPYAVPYKKFLIPPPPLLAGFFFCACASDVHAYPSMNRAGGCCSFSRGRVGRTRQRQGLTRKSILYVARARPPGLRGIPPRQSPPGREMPGLQGGFPAAAAREAAHGPAV